MRMRPQDIPNRLGCGSVARHRFRKVLKSREPVAACGSYSRRSAFSEFEYIPSPYSMAESIRRQERLHHESQAERFGGGAWRAAGSACPLRHEAFGRADGFSVYQSEPDPFGAAEDQALRQKWLQDAAILAGPFRPAGRNKGRAGESSSELPSGSMLPEMVQQIHRQLQADWSLPFVVCSTEDEHIVIRVELSALDAAPGLVAYMNAFARSNHVVNAYRLRRTVEDWNVTPGDGHLYFTLRPPWVRSTSTETFYSLHPEQRAWGPRRQVAASDTSSLSLSTTSGRGEELPLGT